MEFCASEVTASTARTRAGRQACMHRRLGVAVVFNWPLDFGGVCGCFSDRLSWGSIYCDPTFQGWAGLSRPESILGKTYQVRME